MITFQKNLGDNLSSELLFRAENYHQIIIKLSSNYHHTTIVDRTEGGAPLIMNDNIDNIVIIIELLFVTNIMIILSNDNFLQNRN